MYRRFGKRLFDLIFASVLLLATLPLQAVIALIVRLRHGAPVLFRQPRAGLGGRPFVLYKFRTMTEERGADGELRPDAERLTGFGAWLRSTSLDELPTLLNVVQGQMSVVGPRPLLLEYVPMYSRRQAARHQVRPGITGMVQVSGRNALSWGQKFAHDFWYVRNHGLCVDLWILWRTLATVVTRGGITAAEHATMPRFEGRTHHR